jgi:FKBP-type peptidyl-prolyl cis-trans isomerase FklB
MSTRLITTLAATLMLAGATFARAEGTDLTSQQQKLSYALGSEIGANLKKQGVDIDAKAFAAGIADAQAGKLQMTDAQIKETMNTARTELLAKQQVKQQADAAANIKAGDAFLAANAKKDGVKTTASGLQYKVLKAGAGKTPGPKDTVKVHYQGTLIDGTVFDSSIARGEPVEFQVDGVIPGWTEALQLMKVGDKYQLFIPSKLAYGASGAGDKIGPNAVLVFDVELLDIKK